MNVFDIHDGIVGEYATYIKSFIGIRDARVRRAVEDRLGGGELWPSPLIQFNPSYEVSGQVRELVDDGVLHPEVERVFSGYSLYRHQVEAISLGVRGEDFVVTSGTGSGKSLTYLGTIFNHVFRNPACEGILAVIIYPMNALINSQTEEIKKHQTRYEEVTGRPFPIRFAQYTGQEGREERERVIRERPHVLLTNYMMMELVMTRQREAGLRQAIADNLRYLVYDELHTYRGRQGADVGMLNRRIREAARRDPVCIGTSATMASGPEPLVRQRQRVADVAGRVFGKALRPDQVIDEKLERQFATAGVPDRQRLRESMASPVLPDGSETDLVNHPLTVWLESEVGLEEKDGQLVRQRPCTLPEITSRLAEASGADGDVCERALLAVLEWVEAVNVARAERGAKPLLPFKLHQFIAQTGSVYVTLEDRETRRVTLEAGYYVLDEEGGEEKPIFPVVFSRHSGHDFICVTRDEYGGRLYPRDFFDRGRSDDDEAAPGAGYVVLDYGDEPVWEDDHLHHLPESWLSRRKDGTVKLLGQHADKIPRRIWFDASGRFADEPGSEAYPYTGWYVEAPLPFDPTAGVFFDARTSEFTKLATLGSEARSTATSVLSRAVVRRLTAAGVDPSAQKLLSFTDNRQDASLQAGHFNDFVKTLQLRSAIYHAMAAAPAERLEVSNLAQAVFDRLDLEEEEYALNPVRDEHLRRYSTENPDALKKLILYRALYDLRRSWRVVLPNLEQCGLLRVRYKHLAEVSTDEAVWEAYPGFDAMAPARREEVFRHVLDYFRKAYALYHVDLEPARLEQNENVIRDRLRQPWALDRDERLLAPAHLHVTPYRGRRYYGASVGYMSRLGRYLRDQPELAEHLQGREAYEAYLTRLFEGVGSVFLAAPVVNEEWGDVTRLYRLKADAILWVKGDGESVDPDPVQLRAYKGIEAPEVNEYFRRVYQDPVQSTRTLTSAEHTGQLQNHDRQQREDLFRQGQLSALFCSPTMELGIDIADLAVVHMRNVPPNPANYAQRSGRAGRSGQAALVLTYCANHSPHDRHYFRHQRDMVAGAVAPPNIDLANQELLRTHLHALYMAEVGLEALDRSVAEMVELSDPEGLPLKPEVAEKLELSDEAKGRVAERFRGVVADFEADIAGASWYGEAWVHATIARVPQAFDEALDRWRHLYRVALRQRAQAQARLDDPTYKASHDEKREARREEAQARRQLDLLMAEAGRSRSLSEFYPYRYLASEGFLPGYNFTRLPIRAFLPIGDEGEYISRPREMALREFGPRNQVYHNGSKYEVVRQQALDLDAKLVRAKVSKTSGYFLVGDDYDRAHCPFTGATLQGDEKRELFPKLLEMTEVQTRPVASITCEEEERTRRGFDLRTYFAVDGGMADVHTLALKRDGETLLTMKYVPAARLYFVNAGWRFYEQDGFVIETKTGFWKKSPNVELTPDERAENPVERVKLFTSDTADALYLHPTSALGLEWAGVLTLQYALKKAVENVFRVEPGEVSTALMGETDQPNVLIYESAEGSLGVLSQVVGDPEKFRAVVEEAYRVCYFDLPADEEAQQPPASYDDLLSYYNQRYHKDIDRRSIRGALEALMACDVEAQGRSGRDYDEQYRRLVEATDPNSELERAFLRRLRERGLRLPDRAQVRVDGLYVQPDFFYEPDVFVFVDGSVHDTPAVEEADGRKRRALRHNGHRVIEYRYDDDLDALLVANGDVFRRVM